MLMRMFKMLIWPLGSLVLLVGFLVLTNPRNLPAWLLIVPFVLLFLFVFTGLRLLGAALQTNPSAKPGVALPAIGAAVPTLLLIFNSVSQLTPRDVLLSVFFGLGMLWYAKRVNFINR